MKIHKLIRHASVVLEAEDLFPGLGPSAFDEHNTLRDTKRSTVDESDRIDKNVERLTLLKDAKEKEINRIRMDMEKKKLRINYWSTTSLCSFLLLF